MGKPFRKMVPEVLQEQMRRTGVLGWGGYKRCSEMAWEADESYAAKTDLLDTAAKATTTLLGVADVPLICDCGSATAAAISDGIKLAHTIAEVFSVKCSVESREAWRKQQETLAKKTETKEFLVREHENMMREMEKYHNVTNEAMTKIEKHITKVNADLNGIIADQKKLDALQNLMDKVTQLMEQDFSTTKEQQNTSTEAIVEALGTWEDKTLFVELYSSYKKEIRFVIQGFFQDSLAYRHIEDFGDPTAFMHELIARCTTNKPDFVIDRLKMYFHSTTVFPSEVSLVDNAQFLPHVLKLIGGNLGSFSQFVLDITNDLLLAQVVLRQCANILNYSPHTEEIIRKDAEATITDVMMALSRAVGHYQDIYLPRDGKFERNEITILRNQLDNYFKGNQLNPAIEQFMEERERNIAVFRTAVVHMPCPSKNACDKDIISKSTQWIRVVEDRAAYLNDNVQYVAVMDATQEKNNDNGAVPVFATFARPSFVNTSHTKNVDEAVKQCHKNLAKELNSVFSERVSQMEDYDLKSIVGLNGFLEVGHRVLNFTVEKSDGYLKITADKEKKNVFNCPVDYPVRPLAVIYGVSDSAKKWYAGESRSFYPEPFKTQVEVMNTEGKKAKVYAYFHAIVFY